MWNVEAFPPAIVKYRMYPSPTATVKYHIAPFPHVPYSFKEFHKDCKGKHFAVTRFPVYGFPYA